MVDFGGDGALVPSAVFAELQQLYAFQSHAIDSGDAEGWASTFTRHGVFDSPTYPNVVSGRNALAEFASEVSRSLGERQQRHILSNLSPRLISAGHVEVRCDALIVITEPGQAPFVARSVFLVDQIRREVDGWRMASRVVHVDGLEHTRREAESS